MRNKELNQNRGLVIHILKRTVVVIQKQIGSRLTQSKA